MEKRGTARHATGDYVMRRICFAGWITEATNTHSEYVILIALPLQQLLNESISMLRYTYIACLV